MQFLFPGFLWALFALAIPVILHLFYFRRYKRVYFSNVRFLREVKEETSARNKLRNILILLMRCLAIASLVFAFTQPFIPVSDSVQQGRKNVSVFVDNSFSMQSFGEDLPLLDKAKQKATDIVMAYTQEEQFQIMTHDLTASQQRFLGQEEAILALEEIDITPNVVSLSKVIDRQSKMAQNDPGTAFVSYIISDFQRSITTFDGFDTAMQVNLIPVQSVQEKNVTIDTAWFEVPAQLLNQTSRLVIKVTNHSEDNVENVKLTSAVDGQEKPVSTLEIPGGQSVYDTANITILKTGWHEVVLRITDFPVQFDDAYNLTFYVEEDVSVLAINDISSNPRLDAAFANNPNFNLDNQSLSQVNYSTLRNYDLIILNEVREVSSGMTEELYGFIERGGNVLFFPAADVDPAVYQSFLIRCGGNSFGAWDTVERKVGALNTDAFLFRDVYISTNRNLRLPVTQGNYRVQSIQARSMEPVLTYRDGTPAIAKYPQGKGSFIVSSAPLIDDISDLSRNAEIFIPLIYNAAVSTGLEAPNAYTIGSNDFIEIQTPETDGERVYTFKGSVEFIPAMTPFGATTLLDPAGQITEAGFYDLYLGDVNTGVFAFNYDRIESPLVYVSVNELEEKYGIQATVWKETARAAFSQQIREQQEGIILWRWCIILALTFLGLEILLIRFWKT